MQQVHRDIVRELVGTDRGTEAGRTYWKSKH